MMILPLCTCMTALSLLSLTLASTPEIDLGAVINRVIRSDSDAWLAQRFGHLPAEQRGNVGVVPVNLYGLIQGADEHGRLTLPTPSPGHALLLTLPSSSSGGSGTFRGVGILHSPSSGVHYFSTPPFHPPLPALHYNGPSLHPLNHIPPRSTDASLYGSRQLTLHLPHHTLYHPRASFPLAHISVLPTTSTSGSTTPREFSVYPPNLLNDVLKGPPQTDAESGTVQWSDRPNWSNDGPVARARKKISPKKWIADLRKALPQVNKDADSAGSSST